MNRSILVRLGAPSLAALLLAACSGGGSSAVRTAVPSTPSTAPSTSPSAAPAGSGLRLKFTIHRASSTKTSVAARSGAAKRSPKYISEYVQGMQITATSGATSQSAYLDVSTDNTADCSDVNGLQSCTVSVPDLGASETLTAIETDELPTDENQTTFTGDGFPDGTYPAGTPKTNILAIGSNTVTPTPGLTTTVSIVLDPVIFGWTVSEGPNENGDAVWIPQVGIGIDACSSTVTAMNIQNGYQQYCSYPLTNTIRVPVMAGTPQLAGLEPMFVDATQADLDEDGNSGTVAPFVDVDGTATPATIATTSSHLSFLANPNTGYANSAPSFPAGSSSTPSGYAGSVQIPNDGYVFENAFFVDNLNYDGSTPALGGQLYYPATISNALSRTTNALYNPQDGSFTVGPYSASTAIDVVPIQAVPSSQTISLTGTGAPAAGTLTGYDWGGSFNQYVTFNCSNGASITYGYANQSSLGGGGFDEVQFSITPTGSTGTCSVSAVDGYTGVRSNPTTITIIP